MTVSADTHILIQRLKARQQALLPKDPQMREVSMRIGNLIAAQAKINITRQKLVKTGLLRGSISFETQETASKVEIMVGSFGIKYAKVHEFGFNGMVEVKGHMRMGHPVAPHSRNMNIQPRPFLRPALKAKAPAIIDILRELFGRE